MEVPKGQEPTKKLPHWVDLLGQHLSRNPPPKLGGKAHSIDTMNNTPTAATRTSLNTKMLAADRISLTMSGCMVSSEV